MTVSFRPAVAGDLGEIAAFIAQDNPERAITFVEELLAKCYTFAAKPKIGRLRPELGDEVRSRTYKSYVILYRIEPDRVRILRVVHGARDLRRLTM